VSRRVVPKRKKRKEGRREKGVLKKVRGGGDAVTRGVRKRGKEKEKERGEGQGKERGKNDRKERSQKMGGEGTVGRKKRGGIGEKRREAH